MKTFKQFQEELVSSSRLVENPLLKALGKVKLFDIAKAGAGIYGVKKAAEFLGRKSGEPKTPKPKKTKYKKYENPGDGSIPGRYPDESLKDYNIRRNQGYQKQIDKM